MRRLLGLLLFLGACGDSHSDSDVIRVNDASDEVWITLVDYETQNRIMTDDGKAAHLTAPADGAMVSAASPQAFTWMPGPMARTPRHGITTGTFYWLKISGSGIAEPIHVLSVNTPLMWMPDDDTWSAMMGATGPVTVVLTTAEVVEADVTEGPWRPTMNSTFTVAQ